MWHLVEWDRFAQRSTGSADLPALVLHGSWTNRPPAAPAQQGEFSLVHLPARRWVLEQPTGTVRLAGDELTQVLIGVDGPQRFDGHEGWVQEPAGLLASPLSWFRTPGTEAFESSDRQAVAGRPCVRHLVRYSPHSVHTMALWVDEAWPLVLAARSASLDGVPDDRFEVHVTAVERLSEAGLRRYSTVLTETLDRRGLRAVS
jgi:hypothetical protein